MEALKFLSEPQGGRLPCPQLQTVVVPSITGHIDVPFMQSVSVIVSQLVVGRRAVEGREGLEGDGGSVGQPTFMVLDAIGRRFDCEAMAFMKPHNR